MNKTLRTALLCAVVIVTACVAIKPQNKPTLFLIGDSTVKHAKGMGDGGRWGWGDLIGRYFDTTKIAIQNEALGGTSSRTFMNRGRWEVVYPLIKKGDYVIIQFGHNDGSPLDDNARARGTIDGVGQESKEIYNPITKQKEIVYTYGYYLRKYISDIKAKGATPMIASLVPRNNWLEGKVRRNNADYALWAKQVADQASIDFIDLHNISADRYDKEGEQHVRANYFNSTDGTHPVKEGASVNAQSVVEGLKKTNNALKRYLIAN